MLFDLDGTFGDTTAHAKPHPEPMRHAAHLLGVAPRNCLYVGDAERDVIAARAAGMDTLIAAWGYLGQTDRPEDWGGRALIDRPLAVLDHLD